MNEDPISRDDAERIFRDAAGGPRPGQDPLTAFLAAAAGPAKDSERSGEEAAVGAFRLARLAPARRPLVARVLTVKVAVAVGLSATAVGGVALAAGTGSLPGPLDDQRPASEQTTARPTTGRPGTLQPSGGAGVPGAAGGSESPVPSPSATSPASPTPSPEGTDKKKGKAKGHDKTKKPGKKQPKKTKKPKPKKT
jgi:hypothetical protein